MTGIPVALKLYRKAKLTPLNVAQVERESRLQLGLSHPHIIQLYAAFEDMNNYYLVQELAICRGI